MNKFVEEEEKAVNVHTKFWFLEMISRFKHFINGNNE